MNDSAGGALAGLRVVDLTQMLAGPYCAMLLADQGADVVKIEPPEGDVTRRLGPFLPGDEAKAYSGYYQSINRNKRGIVLDLKQAEGKAVLRRLAAAADVVIENYRVGVMERLGLSYEQLAAENPRLVYAAVRGFGDPRTGESPYAEWPAFDVVAQAMGGIMGITGPDAETPLKVGPGVGDIVPAMFATIGLLSAVYRAQQTGPGHFVDVAMCDAVLAICERSVYQQAYTGKTPHPEGNGHPMLCPFGIFAARDGWVSIACPHDDFWAVLAECMGRPELARDQRYASNPDRVEHAAEVIALINDWSGGRSKAELVEILGGRIPFGPVQGADEIMADPHMAARRMLATLEPEGLGEAITIAGSPIRMTETPGGVRNAAPRLGQHTDEVLAAAGFEPAEIAELRSTGAVA